ncbi:MAG: S1-like domain-containing RNA-binding protein [Flavobacteriales bacterium]|nr:S1-like domain-containing RNA-binding protein [Flavobacteriales bacterium]MCW8914026.1 S1-like domain-containing RNA-binding protein [Flavobacteriales bacterium]MCW8938084.1 S1-like domain-containing RNA-binding protein [Flavobacteriales bacterium]MCW8939969.1 S1-like domain-containing RNA-binding protein [Flavobacteriales bacterium]MCW8969398.1 S1-like domain-containing RNA-binding protein [Flavobacteriales bacterium]
MQEIGNIVELESVKTTPQGVYLLTQEGGEVLLPHKYVPVDFEIGDKIEVFVYTDSEDRPIATTLIPKILMYQCDFLKAVDVTPVGAFFEWGVEKDLLVPYSEQFYKIEVGEEYPVYLYKDELTNRMVGSAKIEKHLERNPITLEQGDEVSLLVAQRTDLGYKVVVNNQHLGMLFENEVFRPIYTGDKLKGFVQKVRPDNKLDITLNSSKLDELENIANAIYETLLKEKGKLNITDKSSPELIYSTFKVSKKAFKKAVGILYSGKKIKINPDSIELVR